MAIVRCPTCGARLELEDQYLGQEVDCGDCRAVFVAKAEGAADRPAPPYGLGADDDRPSRRREAARDEDDDRPSRRRRDDDDDRPSRRRRDDDDDDYDDRPSRRRRSRRNRDEDDLADGSARVKPPAVCLIVACAIGLLWRMVDMAFLLAMGNGMLGPKGNAGMGLQPGQDVGAVIGAGLGFTLTPIALFGAVQMYRVRGYSSAMTTAILSLLPCTGCCVLNIPFGIWALVVLSDAQVKRAFELNRGEY